MRLPILLLTALFVASLTACAGSDVETPDGADAGTNNVNALPEGCIDNDGDGFGGRGPNCPDGPDCDDNDQSINPTGTEACGDRVDNNCDGSIDEGCDDCVDGDGDGYGDGPSCLGPDCDDTDRSIRPRAEEICDDGIDQDCDDVDKVCPTNCIDMDNDGFGAEGSTDCESPMVDCDDTNAAINPMATEICNEVDDNCNDTTDECPGTGQACAGGECIGGPGSECLNNDMCVGSLVCDSSLDPKVCKQTEGGTCQMDDNCVSGLACDGGMCTGDFCAVNACNDPGVPFCYRDQGLCVECPIFDPVIANQDAPCPGVEQCTPGGWCAENATILNDNAIGNTANDILEMSKLMADCFIAHHDVDETKDMCFSLFISSQVMSNITESELEDAYRDGDLGSLVTPAQDTALDDLWGVGFLNLKEVTWNVDPVPGTAKEFCIWYEPSGRLSTRESVTIDECVDYSP